MNLFARFLYWWRTSPCPFLCEGRLPNTPGLAHYQSEITPEPCPTCGKSVAWYAGHWRRHGPIQAAPNPRSVA